MRAAFHDDLDAIFNDLTNVCELVSVAVRDATTALLDARNDLAEQVIDKDIEIDDARERIEENALELLGLQSPVAGDLRVVVAALRMISDLERMGDLSVHVAKIARLRTPNKAVPELAQPTIAKMAEIAQQMVERTCQILRTRDVSAAQDLVADDDEMDRLRRQSFAELLGQDWTHGVEPAVDVALLGRYYERIADHAVTVANRVVFVVTGETPADS
ncbi:phosphate signaling complex protein PhoU [Nocardioides panzhihuensis]|uniref:Phosphate-specific transport system accessory protein PhoU n=1 Tax=Nocardioides panzhihuensis TaxID=860243 RepID=A0A7Z0IU36_9ACTN|nr:phosphate signaling complex protein PhoU [Nocardioides panzhihuensis]NYI79507.1 phosphate transport system protein [Nocardioides panzhihuensis]